MTDMKIRNYRSRLCEQYVKRLFPEDYQRLLNLAEENYQFGTPNFTLQTVFQRFLKEKEPSQDLAHSV